MTDEIVRQIRGYIMTLTRAYEAAEGRAELQAEILAAIVEAESEIAESTEAAA